MKGKLKTMSTKINKWRTEAVLRWWRNRTGRPLSPPQIHQKNISTLSKLYKTTSECRQRTSGTRKSRSLSSKTGRKNIKDKKRDKGGGEGGMLLLKTMSAWCPLPAFRSCFVEFTQRLNVLLMNLWGRKWSPHPIPQPSWDQLWYAYFLHITAINSQCFYVSKTNIEFLKYKVLIL